ncbi:MAG: hypothetical protein SFV23_14035 [Planctomycetaceae bacterium]|nr:hypothetical protein [Planctomycetaceae bacterium]
MTSRSHDQPKSPNGTSKNAAVAATDAAGRLRAPGGENWQQQLAQKDELIQALTEQLEQAAEQLDRLQRNGADRRRGPAATALPSGLVDDQRRVVEDLQRVVQQWDDMQAALTLGRIEMQVSEIRDLISQGAAAPTSFVGFRRTNEDLVVHEEPTELDESKEESTAPVDNHWEKLKSQLLGESADSTATDAAWIAQEQHLPDPPAGLDVGSAERTALVQGIAERDEYITMLLSRLRKVETLQPAAELARLDVGSQEFSQRVQALEQRLQEHLRCAEIELSVERAKIARERSHMQHQQDALERQLKKLGLNSIQDLEHAVAPAANVQERRWSRFLGKPKNES